MIFKRCIPPSASPVNVGSLVYGLFGLITGINRQNALESELKNYFSANHVYLVSSGKTALTLILKALATIDNRQEVVIPAYTCFSLPAVIIRSGLKIRLCDINPETLDYDYKKLEEIINKNTLCVVSTNLFGMASNIDTLKELTDRYSLFLVEDVAQAMGCTFRGKKLGTFGDAAFFSLGRGKNLTCGAGGIVVTSSESIANAIEPFYQELPSDPLLNNILEYLKLLVMSVFLHPLLYCIPSSIKFLELGKTYFYIDYKMSRFSRVKAWLMKGWQNRLELANNVREKNSQIVTQINTGISYLRIPYICSSRNIADNLLAESRKHGLGIVGMYPSAICEIPDITEYYSVADYAAAVSIAPRLVTLPSHQMLNKTDMVNLQEYIARYDMHLVNPSIQSARH
jgi:perosamine synthetase